MPIEAFIIIGVPILIGYIVYKVQESNKNKQMEDESLYALETHDYCGGCDLVATDTKVELKWGKDDVLTINYWYAGVSEQIPFSKINRVYAKTEQQIKEDVTLTRLAVFGLFAFGMKKESESSRYYLVISYENAKGIEQNLILDGGSGGSFLQEELNNYNNILNTYKEVRA